MKKNKILHLNLKKKWFEMIEKGEKKAEYREIKKYWTDRFYPFLQDSLFEPNSIPYKIVIFRNGYRKSPEMAFEILGVRIGRGFSNWGATPNKKYFVIKLGKRLTKLADLNPCDDWVWVCK